MQTEWVPLSRLGNDAVLAIRTLRERHGLNLPKPSRIQVKIEREGKFTTASVRSGKRYTVGVAARNPTDHEVPVRGAMTALVRALRKLGGTQ